MDHSNLYNIFDISFDPIVVTDANWDDGLKIIYVNEAFCDATGYDKQELIGKNPKILQGKKSNYKILKELKRELKKGNNFIGQTTNYKKDRTPYLVKWSITPLRSKKNEIVGYVSFQKIIEIKALELKHDKLLSSIVDISKNLILVTDLEGVIIYINQSFSEKLGYEKKELIGKHSRILKSDLQDRKFYRKMWQSILSKGKFSDVFISRKKDGTLFYDKKDISTIYDDDGESLYYVSISQDITAQMEKEKHLKSQVYTDTLTKLYNRRKYTKVMQQKFEKFEKDGKVFSLILVDIDHFKSVNDTYGHEKGDQLLQEFAKLLQENLRQDDGVFRWGGEEFVIVVDSQSNGALFLANKLREKVETTTLAGLEITASFGVAELQDEMEQDQLFSTVDQALYKAKQSGRNRVVVA